MQKVMKILGLALLYNYCALILNNTFQTSVLLPLFLLILPLIITCKLFNLACCIPYIQFVHIRQWMIFITGVAYNKNCLFEMSFDIYSFIKGMANTRH